MSDSSPQVLLETTIDHFWETVPPVWHRVRGNLRALAVEKFGITVEQFHILRHVRKGYGSVSEVAEAKGISRSAVSQAVEVLVEKGLLTRTQSTGDRRFVQLALTPTGDELLQAIFKQNRAWMCERLAGLSPEDLETLVKGLDILKRTLNDLED